ncbi:hypothetical protein HY448_00165 [Candidatus Pacearchaeota archaeon]|nr:hypothetical protein [Candidatus Pacearchaeota archaeon]
MEIEYVHNKKKNKKFYLKLGLFFAFVGIFSLIIYTSFYGGFGFTGSVVSESSLVGNSEQKTIDLNAELTSPELDLSGFFEKVEISGGGESYLEIGDQKFYLGNSNGNYIILNDYDGQIAFDGKILSNLKGRASEIIINGISMSSQSKDTSKVNLQSPFNYKLLELGNQVQIKKVSYTASGKVNLDNGKNEISITDEQITMGGFKGHIKSANENIILSGKIQSLDISGETKIHVDV